MIYFVTIHHLLYSSALNCYISTIITAFHFEYDIFRKSQQWPYEHSIFLIFFVHFRSILGTYRPVTKGDTGVRTVIIQIAEIGVILKHHAFLIRKVRPSDHAPPGVLYVIIDGNHRYYLFTQYPNYLCCILTSFFVDLY